MQLVVLVPFRRGDCQRDGGVDGVEERLAEVGAVHRLGPVVRLVLGVHAGGVPVGELVGVGQEVEEIEVALAGLRALHGHHVLGGIVRQPAVQNVRADGGLVDLAAPHHLRAADERLLIVDVADGVDVHVVLIVVFGVFLHHPAFQRGVLRQIERTAVAGGLGAGAELVAQLCQHGAVGGLEGGIVQKAQKTREVVVQSIGQGVLVHSCHAHGGKIHGRAGGGAAIGGGQGHGACGVDGIAGAVLGHSAVVGIVAPDAVVIVVLSPGHIGGDKAGSAGSVVRVQQIGQRVHKVLRGHGAQHRAGIVHPVLVPQVEGPCQGVGVPLPAGGKPFADLAAAVVLHQRVHAVGAVVQVRVGRADQVVQGGGLTGIQYGVGGAVAGCGSAARRGAAAAAQQPGSSGGKGCCTAGLQKLTAGKSMMHHKNLFRSL